MLNPPKTVTEEKIAILEAELIEDSGETIDAVSKKIFLGFAEFICSAILPTNLTTGMFSLTPDNEIYASWYAKDAKYSFRFCKNGEIHFVRLITKDEVPEVPMDD